MRVRSNCAELRRERRGARRADHRLDFVEADPLVAVEVHLLEQLVEVATVGVEDLQLVVEELRQRLELVAAQRVPITFAVNSRPLTRSSSTRVDSPCSLRRSIDSSTDADCCSLRSSRCTFVFTRLSRSRAPLRANAASTSDGGRAALRTPARLRTPLRRGLAAARRLAALGRPRLGGRLCGRLRGRRRGRRRRRCLRRRFRRRCHGAPPAPRAAAAADIAQLLHARANFPRWAACTRCRVAVLAVALLRFAVGDERARRLTAGHRLHLHGCGWDRSSRSASRRPPARSPLVFRLPACLLHRVGRRHVRRRVDCPPAASAPPCRASKPTVAHLHAEVAPPAVDRAALAARVMQSTPGDGSPRQDGDRRSASRAAG